MKKDGVEGILRKKLMSGEIGEKVEEILNGVGLSLSESVRKLRSRKRLIVKPNQTKLSQAPPHLNHNINSEPTSQIQPQIQVQVLSKSKIPLPHL